MPRSITISHVFCLCFSNGNGSYYYSNDNGSTYYNNGSGSATYTTSSGYSTTYATNK